MATQTQKVALENYITSDNFKSDVMAATRKAQTSEKLHVNIAGVSLEIHPLWYSAGDNLEGTFDLEKEEISQMLRLQLEAK